MTPAEWIGISAVVVTLGSTIGAALIKHIRADDRYHIDHESRIKTIENELGDRDRGLRKSVHDVRDRSLIHDGKISILSEVFAMFERIIDRVRNGK